MCTSSVIAIGNRWTRKREREEEENGFDTLIKLKKPESAKIIQESMDENIYIEELVRSMQADDEGFDMRKAIAESMDLMVEMLSDPAQRKQFDREAVESLILQLPDDVKSSPEMEDALKTSLSALEEMDPIQYQKTVDEILDGMLDYAKEMQELLKDPAGLEKIMSETLSALGISEADLVEAQKLISDPKLMQEAMEAYAASGQTGFEDIDFDQLAQFIGNNDGLDGIFGDLLNDPEILVALNDPNTSELYEKLLKDPELLAALGQQPDDILKTGRKQRA
jgi:hypothetical protein